MNVKFQKNCENTGKILQISCARCNFVKFDIHFLGLPMLEISLVQGFCPLKIKITQFTVEFPFNTHDKTLPSPCSAFSQAFSVNSIR